MKQSIRVAVLVAAITGYAQAINVMVDQNTTYQTIEGLGMQMRAVSWKYRQAPFYVSVDLDEVHYFDTVMADAGFSMLRTFPIDDFQPSPGDFSLSGAVRAELQTEAKFVAAARKTGQEVRFFWTCLSPPPWMKANNSCCQVEAGDPNNYLLPEYYDDFGTHWVKLLELARDTFGFLPYAISLQNEPLFNEPYSSCNYSKGPGCGWNGICYNNMFRVAAPIIHDAFPDVKIVASEDLNRTLVESTLRDDPVSEPLVHAWATHNNFVSSFAYWNDRPIWNTEPHAKSFQASAEMMMANLAAGASVYLEFDRVDDCKENGTPDVSCVQSGTYRGIKMYSRYIRPGASRVHSSGGASGSYGVIAFYHPVDTCLTVVLINSTDLTERAHLSVSGAYQPAEFEAYQSTDVEDEIPVGPVPIDGSIALPPNSVTTLVAGRYRANGGTPTAHTPSTAPIRPAARNRAVRLFTISGREVSATLSNGVYCTSRPNATPTLRLVGNRK